MIAQSKGEKVFNLVNIVLLGVFALLTVYPFLYTLSLSLSSQSEASRNGLHLMPGNPASLRRALKNLAAGRWQPPSGPLRPAELQPGRAGELLLSIGREVTDPVGRYLRRMLPPDVVRACERYAKTARGTGVAGGEALPPVEAGLTRAVLEAINETVMSNREDPMVLNPGESAFRVEDLDRPATILGSWQRRVHPHAQFLYECLTPRDRELVDACEVPPPGQVEDDPEGVPLAVRRAMVRGLNRAAELPGDIYTPERFRFVTFMKQDLRRDVTRPARGQALLIRNRRLIQAMYGRAIWKLDERRFQAVPVPALGRRLALRRDLPEGDFTRMNRLHLWSAYPDVFKREPGVRGHWAEFASGISLSSYAIVLKNRDVYVGYANTVFRTVTATFLVLLFTAIAAFPLARRNLPHRGAIVFLLLMTMLFHGGLIPQFLLLRNIGLYNSRWVYILPGLLTAFNIILMRNFFQSIPESLYESAMVDGAGDWRILFQIYLPLSKPVLATVALWTAVAHWNEWFTPLIYIDDTRKQVLQFFLQRIVINNQTQLIEQGLIDPDAASFTSDTIKAAMVLVTMIPILCVYPFIQKFFVKGVMLGSVKE